MIRKNRRAFYSLFAPIVAISAIAALAAPVAAQAQPAAKHPKGAPSYVVLDRNGSTLGRYKSPCTKSGCPNAVRFFWTAGVCVKTASTVCRSIFSNCRRAYREPQGSRRHRPADRSVFNRPEPHLEQQKRIDRCRLEERFRSDQQYKLFDKTR